MKKLGFGLMRLPLLDPNDKKSIDLEQLKQMVDTFLARGFTYFDTAWMYCSFESENATRKALVERHPRESFTLADKLHCEYIKTKEDRDAVFEEQLRKTGAGYFDYYLIHDVSREHYKVYDALECFPWVLEKKAKGLVRKVGMSFHDTADVLDEILAKHARDLDFVQLQINYLDWESEKVQSRLCYEVATRYGLPVIVMEPVKGGTLAKKLPESVEAMFRAYQPDWSAPSWAIRFAASLDNVMMVLSGMSDMEQLLDNTDYMADFKPLCETEQRIVHTAAKMIKDNIAIPCTACEYCVDGCPMNIAIPRYFTLYNSGLDAAEGKKAYGALAERFGKASDCIACGGCESICPQHLPIIDHLRTLARHFED